MRILLMARDAVSAIHSGPCVRGRRLRGPGRRRGGRARGTSSQQHGERYHRERHSMLKHVQILPNAHATPMSYAVGNVRGAPNARAAP
jgi:hypothetical protein